MVVAPITEKQYLFLVRHTPYFALKVMRVLASTQALRMGLVEKPVVRKPFEVKSIKV